jgi:hypothetical protein
MIRGLLILALLSLVLACGCSGTPGEPKNATSAKESLAQADGAGTKKVESKEAKRRRLPTECVAMKGMCFPPSSFVDRLCKRNHPDVAVYMMGPGQPWTHRYVRVAKAQAINPITGRVGVSKLTFGEEIIMLRYREGITEGPIKVSGTQRYEILRWDGSCAALEEGEFVKWIPAPQKRYVVPTWTRISDTYQQLLLQHSAVAEAVARKRAECKGAGLGRPPKCHRAIEALNGTVADVVHDGIELPLPAEVP